MSRQRILTVVFIMFVLVLVLTYMDSRQRFETGSEAAQLELERQTQILLTEQAE